MEILVLFATLFLLIVIGVPVGFAIGGICDEFVTRAVVGGMT